MLIRSTLYVPGKASSVIGGYESSIINFAWLDCVSASDDVSLVVFRVSYFSRPTRRNLCFAGSTLQGSTNSSRVAPNGSSLRRAGGDVEWQRPTRHVLVERRVQRGQFKRSTASRCARSMRVMAWAAAGFTTSQYDSPSYVFFEEASV
jgi:hypothetical protein